MTLSVGERPGQAGSIYGVTDADPVQRLAAAVIALALDDARHGVPRQSGSRAYRVPSDEPRRWLADELTRESWIALVTPRGVEPEQVQAQLVAFAGVAGN